MSRIPVIAILFGVVALVGCDSRTASAPPQPTPQGQSMQRMLTDIATLRNYVARTAPKPEAEAAASDLATWTTRLADLFPPERVPSLYADMTADMARQAPQALSQQVAALRLALSARDQSGVAPALDRVERDGCGFCHRRPYRMPAP